jgi:prepilin-type N-terminal cleavage/methylation domain-containing protein
MNRRGFTLVELLAAISVAAIALVMLASAVKSQGSSAVYQMGSADMQQNVRGALDLFRREVRMAGYGMSGVLPGTLPILRVPAAADGELYRVELFGNYGFVKSRVNTAGVAGGGSTVPLLPTGAAGACLPGTPAKQFTVDQRVSIESALRGIADVYTITAYSSVNCTITVSPTVVAGGYESGSPVNEVQQVTYVLRDNNVLTRNGVLAADQIDALVMAYILRDGAETADPAAVLTDLRSATIRLKAAQAEHDGLTPQAELAGEVRIRNLAIVRSPMIDNP